MGGKNYSYPERKEECKSPAQLRGYGKGEDVFSWSEASGNHSRGKERGNGRRRCSQDDYSNGVKKTSSIIVEPIRHEEPCCCIIPARYIFPARLTSVTKLLTINLFLPSVRRESIIFSLTFASGRGGGRRARAR